jgi:hypothetical protein
MTNSTWDPNGSSVIIGYRMSEHQLTPASDLELLAPMAVHWHPGVHAAAPGDTILVMPGGCDLMTRSSVWPELRVQVKGHDVPCAGLLLIRDEHSRAEHERSRELDAEHALFQGFGLPDDDQDGARMDSIWELDLTSSRSVFEESESEYSEESVLD